MRTTIFLAVFVYTATQSPSNDPPIFLFVLLTFCFFMSIAQDLKELFAPPKKN